jgi:hypothetical protein
MKKTFFLAILIAIFSLTSCNQEQEEEKPDMSGIVPDYHSYFDSLHQEKQKQKAKNLEITRSQEIPTGTQTFDKLLSFILKKGFVIYEGKGKQYTFLDNKGNRHAYLAVKFNSTNTRYVDTGSNYRIIVYGYYKGIKDQKHFFPYLIDSNKVYNDILKSDNTWPDAEAVRFGYQEFLKKIEREG